MKKFNTSDRLRQIMSERNLKQVDILNLAEPYCKKYNIKLNKNDLSQYVSGKVEPGQNKLFILALALNVNEAWLMGFDDVSMDRYYDKKHDNNTSKKRPMTFSQKLRKKRNEAGLTIEELAEASGIDIEDLKRSEQGVQPNSVVNKIGKLAQALKVEPIELLPDDNPLSSLKLADSGKPYISKPLTSQEKKLLNNYNILNQKGKEKLIDYSDDLVGNSKYTDKQEK